MVWRQGLPPHDGSREGGNKHSGLMPHLIPCCFPGANLLRPASEITEKQLTGNNRDGGGHWPQNPGTQSHLWAPRLPDEAGNSVISYPTWEHSHQSPRQGTWHMYYQPRCVFRNEIWKGMGHTHMHNTTVETPSAGQQTGLSTDSRGLGFRAAASSWTSAFKAKFSRRHLSNSLEDTCQTAPEKFFSHGLFLFPGSLP